MNTLSDVDVIDLVTNEPQTTSEIYRRLAGIDDRRERLTRAHKNRRRRLGDELEALVAAGRVKRGVAERPSPHGPRSQVVFYR